MSSIDINYEYAKCVFAWPESTVYVNEPRSDRLLARIITWQFEALEALSHSLGQIKLYTAGSTRHRQLPHSVFYTPSCLFLAFSLPSQLIHN